MTSDATLKRGTRISVYWDEERCWYDGTVRDYDDCTSRHLVVYDDGDQRHECLQAPLLWKELPQSHAAPKRVAKPAKAAAPEVTYPRVRLKLRVPTADTQCSSGSSSKGAKSEHAAVPAPHARGSKKAKRVHATGAAGAAGAAAPAGDSHQPKRVHAVKAAAAASSSQKARHAAAPAAPPLWPCGNDWRPKTHDWGTRHPEAFGCGKCRWRPSGCRGCIAAASDYVPVPTPPPVPGRVTLPPQTLHAHVYAHVDDGPNEAARRDSVRALLRSSVRVADGPAQSDPGGFGVVARRRLAGGEVLHDLSVFYVARPSDYALAHLPQYHALELGSAGYFLLREPALGHTSLTYYVNEAGHADHEGGEGVASVAANVAVTAVTANVTANVTAVTANVAYKVVRARSGGTALALLVLAPIAEGEELLARYDQRLRVY